MASHFTLGRVDKDLLDRFSPGLEVISSVGAGYDFVDVDLATQNRQWVTNTPGVVDDATADMTILLLLGTLRNQYAAEYALRHGLTVKHQAGRDPTGMTLGIVGMGGIGKAVAKRAQALGMNIVYHNRKPIQHTLENVVYMPTLDALLEASDVVSIHVPLTTETRHLFGAEQFGKMKPGSYLINTSRGPVVHEDALVSALESGHIAGAGLDVFEYEPKVHPGLLKNMNVSLMPHHGAFTIDTMTKMEDLSLENIDRYLSSGSLVTPVNHFV
ncbi:hypothetical protein BGZ99_009756 [Dissophora globulifera]|uniref:Uncharacterized protein n=1 Tax=Dissophora globulifera TaxID=979702 RepID=A0A9P6RV86_9FUNG|nr:hypothetical protein BGZ99_009756 [Dissophora globulifera]